MRANVRLLTAGVLAGSSLIALAAVAQTVSGPPDKPLKNLQVLSSSMTRQQVEETMEFWTESLGVDCAHCHVAKNPDDYATYDFPSDDKEPKRVARAMLLMTFAINNKLLPATGRDALLEVKCITCHRGMVTPHTIVDILDEAYDDGGTKAVLSRYHELKGDYSNRGVYDFRRGLVLFGKHLARDRSENADARRVLQAHLEMFPGDSDVKTLLAEIPKG